MTSPAVNGHHGIIRRIKMAKQEKDNILDEILSEKVVSSSIKEEDKVLEPLLDEINLIEDEGIKSFVRSILYRADGFWEIPASFSGKHHPLDERCPGGNVLHTKRAVRVGCVLADSYSLSTEERDVIVAALLLHDITKGIKPQTSDKYYYDPMHPYTAGSFIKKCQEEDRNFASESQSSTLFINEDDVQTILRLIRCHLGPWSPVPETTPITYMDMIVHLSDNVSSKLHIIVDGEEIVKERWDVRQ
jgi:hypothetical protein